jgi:hypothetical protein
MSLADFLAGFLKTRQSELQLKAGAILRVSSPERPDGARQRVSWFNPSTNAEKPIAA